MAKSCQILPNDRLSHHHLQTFFGKSGENHPLVSSYPLQSQPICLDHPKVNVCYHQTDDGLAISFYIQKNPQHSWLNLAPWNPLVRQPKKCLWQHHCFECFFQLSQQTGYFEINVSPNGDFNIYEFDDYRTPNCLPPPSTQQNIELFAPCFEPMVGYESRHFLVKLMEAQLRCQKIQAIHVCAILYQQQQPIFYAIRHADPADFHDRHYWQAFNSK